MKKSIILIVVCVCVAFMQVGCVMMRAPFMPPVGGAFTSIEAPLDVDYDSTTLGMRTGEASSHNILGLIAFGDASTQAAAMAGGLLSINHADYKILHILGIYTKTTVVVYGD